MYQPGFTVYITLALMATFHSPVTPAEIAASLRELIEGIVPEGNPIYVEVSPIDSGSKNDCFIHVPERVAAEGGSQVTGWSLWELPGVFVEAEAHSVWLRPDGQYRDIAPKNSATARVLFLPDACVRFEGRQINNVRKPVARDPAVQAYLHTYTEEFELLNRGDRVGQFGEISLKGEEASEYHAIQTRRARAWMDVIPRLPEIGPYTPCPCGSGMKLKWCHKSWK